MDDDVAQLSRCNDNDDHAGPAKPDGSRCCLLFFAIASMPCFRSNTKLLNVACSRAGLSDNAQRSEVTKRWISHQTTPNSDLLCESLSPRKSL